MKQATYFKMMEDLRMEARVHEKWMREDEERGAKSLAQSNRARKADLEWAVDALRGASLKTLRLRACGPHKDLNRAGGALSHVVLLYGATATVC